MTVDRCILASRTLDMSCQASLLLASSLSNMHLCTCRILSEDKAMVEQLRPEMLPREISVKADLPQIAFRKLRQEYIDMGYGVSPEATENRYRMPDQ